MDLVEGKRSIPNPRVGDTVILVLIVCEKCIEPCSLRSTQFPALFGCDNPKCSRCGTTYEITTIKSRPWKEPVP